jgi:signal transduction histidine kinase
VKLVFNVVHLTVDSVVACLIFRLATAPGGLLSGREVGATLLATSASILVGVICVVAAISLAEGELQLRMFPRVLSLGLIGTLTNASLALVAVATIRTQSWATWLLVVPSAMLIFAYRAYNTQRQQHRRLQDLNEATRAVQESREIEPAMLALLERARTMFRAEIAEIMLLPTDDNPALRTTLGPGDHSEVLVQVELDPREGVWARVSSEQQGVLLSKPIRNERLRQHFEARSMRDIIVAPLRAEDGIAGVMLVANRLGEVTTFDSQDLELFEMLANHASVSLQNARLMSQLQESLVSLTELNRMKDDFVATVSHELRTPLTSIQGSVKTILRMTEDEVTREQLLQVIDRQGDRLRMLIEDLLLVSKVESQALPMLNNVDVSTIVSNVTETLQGRLGKRELTVEVQPGLRSAFAHEETVHRILCNLIENAIKYSPDGTPVSLRAEVVDGSVVFAVEDHGYGVEPEHHEVIFDRFYQVDQSLTRRAGGAGLGLYICRRLAERMGAHVWLERSAPGVGSVFCLRVPAAQAPALNIDRSPAGSHGMGENVRELAPRFNRARA